MSSVRTVQISRAGGPEVMQLKDHELPEPGPGQVRVRNHAIGLNFIDTYHRSGLYPLPLPAGLGLEAAGTVEAVGEGAAWQPGDRVAYCSAGIGAYSEAVIVPADRIVPIPDGIDFDTAAAVLLKGATVEYLLRRLFTLRPGHVTLFHAAAGGVGLLFGQWAAALGVELIGTVGSEAKRELALANGYQHCLLSGEDNVVEEVRRITDGSMLPVVYDGVGAATFTQSLDCLAPRGLMVSFGNASGSPPPFDLQHLAQRGSLFITRPSLMAYVATEEEMRACAAAVFERVLDGTLKVTVAQRYPLAEVQRAHAELQARRTVGSSLLIP
ncbi:MAG: quinone oxidoreductase [Halieaceae bacterium]|jgi:NADPH2:quinone reductase|nr:quinone oxidoreductase [Halieaceae bacterium]